MRIFIWLILLLLPVFLAATNQLDYVVYFQKQYIQGKWINEDKVIGHDGDFLVPEIYSDLFGSGDDQAYYEKILERLKAKSKGDYQWEYLLVKRNDTVFLTIPTHQEQKNVPILTNEITASFTSNYDCNVVGYTINGEYIFLTKTQISIPVMDICPEKRDEMVVEKEKSTIEKEKKSWPDFIFYVSLVLNIVLIIAVKRLLLNK